MPQKAARCEDSTLLMALEMGEARWKIGFKVSAAQKARKRTVNAGDLTALSGEIRLAKKRFGLSAMARTACCYEAGREAFWVHRALTAMGVDNHVVDSASIEVNRRHRRAKTDNLDLESLLKLLWRYEDGDKKAFSVVRVPSEEAEDLRRPHRELQTLKHDRTRHSNRIKGLLKTQGVKMPIKDDFVERLSEVRLWNGSALPSALRRELEREYQRLALVRAQIREIETERREALKSGEAPDLEQIRKLMDLRAMGINSSWLLVREFFGWREFRNRREVGSLAGLTPTPFASGTIHREHGIGKDGNPRVRAMIVEIAWGWLRFQPRSELSRWYQRRFGSGNSRIRRVGIVALARKLLVALWRYLDQGIIPAGAELKA